MNKMYISNTDARFLGVCGGIAEFFWFNSTTLRIIFIIFAFNGGISILLYIALAFLMPNKPYERITD